MFEARRLLLIVPGGLGPVPDPDAVAALLPDLPALGRFLARARPSRDAAQGGEAAVCEAFAIDGPPWPIAALARAGEADADASTPGSHGWLRADPVHLRVETGHARLVGSYALALERSEAERLVESLNTHFAADGLRFEAAAPDRWYLALRAPAAIETHSPAEVAGRNVDAFMPGGADARLWRGRLNEVQMRLHDAPANVERSDRGALPVNSIWIWGGGSMPSSAPAHPPAAVLAADPLTRGLARFAGSDSSPLPDTAWDWEARPGTTVAVDWGLRDPLVHGEPEAWLAGLQRVERDWIAPLLERLRAGDLDEVELRPADGRRFRLRRRDLRLRFWRRTRSWSRWLEAGS